MHARHSARGRIGFLVLKNFLELKGELYFWHTDNLLAYSYLIFLFVRLRVLDIAEAALPLPLEQALANSLCPVLFLFPWVLIHFSKDYRA